MSKEFGLHVLTKGTEKVSQLIFPYEVIERESSLIEVKNLLSKGKSIIFLTNHFSTRDAIQGLQVYLKYLAPYSEKTVMPLAKHMYKPWMTPVLARLNVETYPIRDFSWNKIKEAARSLPQADRRKFFIEAEKEFQNYLQNAEIALNNGGLVGIASQAKREPKLNEPKAFPVTTILEKTNVDTGNIYVVCVGIGFAGTRDYTNPEVRGYNKGDKFVVKMSEVFNLAEVLKQIEADPTLKNIDYWVYKQFINLVPKEYLGESS